MDCVKASVTTNNSEMPLQYADGGTADARTIPAQSCEWHPENNEPQRESSTHVPPTGLGTGFEPELLAKL